MIIREERIAKLFATRVMDVLPSGCSIWMGGINDQGYGLIRDGKRQKRAHRVAWEIRRLAASKSQPEIAAMFGIDRSNVSVIVLRKGWKHVSD